MAAPERSRTVSDMPEVIQVISLKNNSYFSIHGVVLQILRFRAALTPLPSLC
jgi:hypothetical protein